MNKAKKEELRKHLEARVGLSKQEIKELDHEDAILEEIDLLTRIIHGEKFPEEYDCMGDSSVDLKDRNKDINPMNSAYIAKVAARRKALGVSPLTENGISTSDDTWKIAYAEAEAIIRINNGREDPYLTTVQKKYLKVTKLNRARILFINKE